MTVATLTSTIYHQTKLGNRSHEMSFMTGVYISGALAVVCMAALAAFVAHLASHSQHHKRS